MCSCWDIFYASSIFLPVLNPVLAKPCYDLSTHLRHRVPHLLSICKTEDACLLNNLLSSEILPLDCLDPLFCSTSPGLCSVPNQMPFCPPVPLKTRLWPPSYLSGGFSSTDPGSQRLWGTFIGEKPLLSCFQYTYNYLRDEG